MLSPDREAPIPAELDGAALVGVVRTLLETSWGKARGFIESGKIALDGVVCTDERRAVVRGERLTLTMNAPRPRPDLDRIAAAIVHLDAHVVVLDKPPGINTVPFEEHERGTLDQQVFRYLSLLDRRRRAAGGARGGRSTLGIVHRLDRETSGLLVFARSWAAKESLGRQFRDHTTHRRYLAIVHGHAASQTVRSHLLEDRGDGLRGSWERLPLREQGGVRPRGQLAVTHLEALEHLPGGPGGSDGGATLVGCRPETGRTHQIRIHLAEAGHPLLGERGYIRNYEGRRLDAPRVMLHAAELGFVHPATRREVRWERPLPADMTRVLERLRR